MGRFFAICCAMLALFAAPDVFAQMMGREGKGPPTTNPDDSGYARDEGDRELYPVEWTAITSGCEGCEILAVAYNKTVKTLLYTRFWKGYIADEMNRLDNYEDIHRRPKRSHGAMAELDLESNSEAAIAVAYRMSLEDMAASLPALDAQEESLDQLAEVIFLNLNDCQRALCHADDKKYGPFVPVVSSPDTLALLPFEWKGSYPPICKACAKHSQRLNALPDDALVALADLEEARARLIFLEMDIMSIHATQNAILLSMPNDKRAPEERLREHEDYGRKAEHTLADLEKKYDRAQHDIAAHEERIDKIAQSFSESLASYEPCVQNCPRSAQNPVFRPVMVEVFGPPLPKTVFSPVPIP